MAKCEYIEELGLSQNEYDTDTFVAGSVEREAYYKQQKEKYGFDSRECYALDLTLAVWLYSHLRLYKDDAEKIVALHETIVPLKEGKKPLDEVVNELLEEIKLYLVSKSDIEDTEKYGHLQRALKILSEAIPYLWW